MTITSIKKEESNEKLKILRLTDNIALIAFNIKRQ